MVSPERERHERVARVRAEEHKERQRALAEEEGRAKKKKTREEENADLLDTLRSAAARAESAADAAHHDVVHLQERMTQAIKMTAGTGAGDAAGAGAGSSAGGGSSSSAGAAAAGGVPDGK